MNKVKNPQAFPTKNMLFNIKTNNVEVVEHGGMTLLDYFAGQALVGVLSAKRLDECGSMEVNGRKMNVSKGCYTIAKSMLKERAYHNE